jgi:hypothetical protein
MVNDTIIKRWVQNSWAGGISTDKFQGAPNSYAYGYNMDVQSNNNTLLPAMSHYVGISSVFTDTKETIDATGASGYFIDFLAIAGYIVGITNTGELFTKQVGVTAPATAQNAWTNRKSLGGTINGFGFYNDYIYYSIGDTLYRLEKSWITTGTGAAAASVGTFSAASTPVKRPMLEIYNKLYIGDGKFLAEVDDTLGSPVFTADSLEIPLGEEICAITFNGSIIKIYSSTWDSTNGNRIINDSKCYTWDGVSFAYNHVLHLTGMGVVDAIVFQGNDYILIRKIGVGQSTSAGENIYNPPSLFMTNGYDLQEIVSVLPSINAFYAKRFLRATANAIYILGQNEIIKYGREHNDMPITLTIPYAYSNSQHDTDGVENDDYFPTALIVAYGMLITSQYYLTDLDTICYTTIVGVTTNTARAVNSFVVSRIFTDGEIGTKKRLRNIKIVYHFPDIQLETYPEIRLYLRKDFDYFGLVGINNQYIRFQRPDYYNNDSTSQAWNKFSLVKTITKAISENAINKNRIIITDNEILNGLHEFYALQYKLEIYNPELLADEYMPTIFQIEFEYDYIYE